jgi:hypothetical protein
MLSIEYMEYMVLRKHFSELACRGSQGHKPIKICKVSNAGSLKTHGQRGERRCQDGPSRSGKHENHASLFSAMEMNLAQLEMRDGIWPNRLQRACTRKG